MIGHQSSTVTKKETHTHSLQHLKKKICVIQRRPISHSRRGIETRVQALTSCKDGGIGDSGGA